MYKNNYLLKLNKQFLCVFVLILLHVFIAGCTGKTADFFYKNPEIFLSDDPEKKTCIQRKFSSQNNSKKFPLHKAVVFNKLKKIDKILGHRSMYTRILKMRGKKIDINDRDHLGFTPLHWAIDIGNNILIEKLLKYGAGVNETDNNKSNFLHEAIKQDNLLAVQLLLQYKAADVNIVDNNGNSFCHLGASIDNLEILKNLIQYIPEESRKNILNQINTEGEMLIHLATKKGYKSVVEILLQNEADVNATTQDGCTPLYLAAGSGNLEIVNLLLKHGADIHKKTKNNDTPLQVADRLGYRLVVEILIQKAVKIALIKDTDINAVVDTNGNTLFHWAVNYGDLKSVRALLLSKKLNKNQKNNLEQTASDLESINNYEAITKLLKNNNLFDKSKDFFQRTFSLK